MLNRLIENTDTVLNFTANESQYIRGDKIFSNIAASQFE